MKAATLTRLARLEESVTMAHRPRLQLVDLTTDRDALSAFWDGTDPVPDVPDGTPPGTILRVVIAPTLDAFDQFRATVDVDDEDLLAMERAEEKATLAQEKEAERKRNDPVWGLPPAPANAYNPVHEREW